MENFIKYAEAHPWLVGGLSLGAVLILLWLFGFFGSSSSSSSSSSGNNLAAAYYAAEAAQTTAGTQLQMATVAYGAQTAQDQIQATAAQGIAATQATMYTTLGQQQTGVAINNSNDALTASNTAASYAAQTAQAGYNAQTLNSLYSNVINPELQLTGGTFATTGLPGIGEVSIGPGGVASPNQLIAQGYTPGQALQVIQSQTGWL